MVIGGRVKVLFYAKSVIVTGTQQIQCAGESLRRRTAKQLDSLLRIDRTADSFKIKKTEIALCRRISLLGSLCIELSSARKVLLGSDSRFVTKTKAADCLLYTSRCV